MNEKRINTEASTEEIAGLPEFNPEREFQSKESKTEHDALIFVQEFNRRLDAINRDSVRLAGLKATMPGRLSMSPEKVRSGYQYCIDSNEFSRRKLLKETALSPHLTSWASTQIQQRLCRQSDDSLSVFLKHKRRRNWIR